MDSVRANVWAKQCLRVCSVFVLILATRRPMSRKGSIRYCTDEMVTLVAGSELSGFADGIGAAAKFQCIFGLMCTSGGDRLLAADFRNHRIRMVDIKTRAVTTIAGDGEALNRDGVGLKSSIVWPNRIAFDRSPTVKPDSVLFITADQSIRRFEIHTGRLSTCKWNGGEQAAMIDPHALCSTPSGQLLVSCSRTVHRFDPKTGEHEALRARSVHIPGECGGGR